MYKNDLFGLRANHKFSHRLLVIADVKAVSPAAVMLVYTLHV